jgi:retinol-binding protein 3
MTRPLATLLAAATLVVAAASTGASAACAQATPVANAATIPASPAGRALSAWLDAFNSGDAARMDAYYKRWEPAKSAESQMGFRTETGGFDVLQILRSEPQRVEFVVKERKGPRTARGRVAVAAEKDSVTGFSLRAIPAGVTLADYAIDAATRARVIDGAVGKLNASYVFPDVAKKMEEAVRARAARGEYDAIADGDAFAERLTEDFRAVSRDRHLGVNFSPAKLPTPNPGGPPPEARERMRRQMEQNNCAFERVERMAGNVGYLKFNGFADVEACAPTVQAAMGFLANVDALIVDLRDNGGGSPAMVAYVSSWLFAERTHLNDLWTRATNATEEFWTRPDVPGKKLAGKPVYVLTSRRTFSGAEEFSYNLKALKRATIVGETTGGGAHPVNGQRIDDHFMIGVPFARAVNPVTKTNWEGTGVEPDVKVPAAEALATALKLASEKRTSM